jgi:protein-S-isoprenylcysteine O-methyltransferase Ste14
VNRARAVFGSLLFLVIAPGTVAVYLPWVLTRWRFQPPFLGQPFTRGIGVALIALGVPGLLDSFARFALVGRGTPAPVAPPDRLVAHGLYRFVRNPMYVALVCAVAGQALLFGSRGALGYAAVLWLAFHLFVLGYEEPALRARFAADYARYCAHVGRWIPRLTPYDGGG